MREGCERFFRKLQGDVPQGVSVASGLCSPKPFFRELSSAGSERLPYKQRVGGSNPSAPTLISTAYGNAGGFFVRYKGA